MNICMPIWTYLPLRIGGAEKQIRHIAASLSRQGHTITVLTRRHFSLSRTCPQEASLASIHRIHCASGFTDRILQCIPPDIPGASRPLWLRCFPIRGLAGHIQMRLFMKRAELFIEKTAHDIDILDSRMLDWLGGWTCLMGHRHAIPVVGTASTSPCFSLKSRPSVPQGELLDLYIRKFDGYAAKTQASALDLEKNGIKKDVIEIIPNGVVIPPIQADPKKNSECLFVGNLTQGKWKGLDTLFDAWGKVTEKQPTARLTILGNGNSLPYRRRLDRAGCASSVRFAGYQDDLSLFYTAAGIFLLPSETEGMSNALLEAISYGLPAIVSDIPGNTAVITNNVHGLVVPVGDSASLADAIIKLLNNPHIRAEQGRQARLKAETDFEISRIALKTEAFYKKTMERAKTRIAHNHSPAIA